MSDPFVSIIIRSFNEGWALRDTLPALQAQDYKDWELIVIDSGSTDGSVDLIRKANPRHFIQIRSEEYNPARVMNQGMQLARSEFGVFLNADATPQGTGWLRPLVKGLQDPKVGAVFGRQIPRPDCQAVFAHDYKRCFGADRESTQWDHFFSMVSSGLRKDIWAQRGFLEKMQYSEDDEYTRWCVAQGYKVVYVPESVVMHSHNYTPAQAYKRSFGEAKALAAVWNGGRDDINFPKTVLLGWANDARRDLVFCSRERRLDEWPHAARIRWHQRRAKLQGFREGWKFYRNGNSAHSTNGNSSSLQPNGSKLNGDSRQRFTLDGSDALELRLAALCEKVRRGIEAAIPADHLQAIVLGGGYGRGQGGVLKTAAGDQPYNDLEFYVFLRGSRILNERRFAKSLHDLGERLSPEAGLHVEFKIESLDRLRRSPVTMFSYDLVSGHKVIHGAANLFDGCEHHGNAAAIPLHEATRLLFNRCTGLLLAKEMLRSPILTEEQSDFIGRNIAKAELALGDVVLVTRGEYHWSCVERNRRLQRLSAENLPWLAPVQQRHAVGVEFKLHPQRVIASRGQFVAEHAEICRLALNVWLWLENERLRARFSSAHDYAFSEIRKCSGSTLLRNALLNARTFGPGSLCDGSALHYPRERLLNSLPLLLWDEPMNDLKVRRHLQNQLRTDASDWQGFVAAYKRIWPSFS